MLYKFKQTGVIIMNNYSKTDDEWKDMLTPIQYKVTRRGGTEPPFSGALYLENRTGSYFCICCDSLLFTSEMKFDSGCGWPSFHTEHPQAGIRRLVDRKFGMVRVEVRCGNCDAHLGHVFEDGPRQFGGERYCINSVSMRFKEGDQNGE